MINSENERYLISIELKKDAVPQDEYPFSLPVISSLRALEFHPRVTFFIGENGSGKSTLLEALAVVCGFNPEGGSKNFTFSTKATHSELYQHLKAVRGFSRPKDGYFLRAESFYNVETNIDMLELAGAYGGESLHQKSHGEAFFALFMNRFKGNGLYLLDEPEAALSPTRQLAFLSRLHELTQAHSQFIIATHSPLIMAYPDAVIYELGKNGIRRVQYEQTEQFEVYKSFFNDYKRFFYEIIHNEQS